MNENLLPTSKESFYARVEGLQFSNHSLTGEFVQYFYDKDLNVVGKYKMETRGSLDETYFLAK